MSFVKIVRFESDDVDIQGANPGIRNLGKDGSLLRNHSISADWPAHLKAESIVRRVTLLKKESKLDESQHARGAIFNAGMDKVSACLKLVA